MDGRYEVFEFKGKGVFSSVLRARDRSRAIAGSMTSSSAAGEGGENVAEVRRPLRHHAPSRPVSFNGISHLTYSEHVSGVSIDRINHLGCMRWLQASTASTT